MHSKRERKINGESGIGMSLINSQKRKKKEKFFDNAKFHHPDKEEIKENEKKDKLKSVIDQNSLTEYMQLSILANKQFDAQKQSEVRKIDDKVIIDFSLKKGQGIQSETEILNRLRIPRRPDWRKYKDQKEELEQQENHSYVEWRKQLAELEQGRPDLIITPYEKNIQIWKQLWRVAENSHLLLQIVDGRDIMFYRCEDLELYLQELNQCSSINRECWLIINKADLISDQIRTIWADYLNKSNIKFVFFSAIKEQKRILEQEQKIEQYKYQQEIIKEQKYKQIRELKQSKDKTDTNILSDLKIEDQVDQQIEQQQQTEQQQQQQSGQQQQQQIVLNSSDILDVDGLSDLLFEQSIDGVDVIQIGTVGYPNVGKSSVINVLCGQKVVGVGSMPGKTRHIQTYDIKRGDKVIRVCDCPGLVFPSIKKSSRAGLILGGVLSVHQMRDYIGPIDTMISKVGYNVLNFMYGLQINDKNVQGRQLLERFCRLRGYHSGGGSGTYDLNRASRHIINDYLSGKLLYVELPSDYDNHDYHVNQSNEQFRQQLDQIESIEYQNQQDHQDQKHQQDDQDDLVFFESSTREQIVDQLVDLLDHDDDIIALIEGKKVKGVKLDKNLRRDIKHMMSRNQDINIIEILSRDGVIFNNHKLHSNTNKPMYKNKGKIHSRF